MGCKKQGAKKQGHCYSKREEAKLLLLFLNSSDSYFGPFFKVPDPKKISGQPDKLE